MIHPTRPTRPTQPPDDAKKSDVADLADPNRLDAPPDDPRDEKESGPERRLHQRIPVLFEVDYRADDTFLFAYITDLSVMGIFIHTAQPETPGTRLYLRFSPPDGNEPIEAEGDVIWINPPRDVENRNTGMGIQFVNLASDHSERLINLIRTFAWLDDPKPENCH